MTHKTIKALLIEDNPDDVDILREELAEASHEKIELECEERLTTGLKRLEGGNIDVVLLDISLPDCHGLDTFTKVHACALEIPIIVLTNFDNHKFAIKAVKEGAQDYLIKGNVDGESLVRSIRFAIERHQKLKEFKPAQTRKPRSFLKFWKDFKPYTGIQKKGGLDDIYSIEQFRVIILRERTRVYRGGHSFSLVIFDIENVVESVPPDYLVQIVLSRKLPDP